MMNNDDGYYDGDDDINDDNNATSVLSLFPSHDDTLRLLCDLTNIESSFYGRSAPDLRDGEVR